MSRKKILILLSLVLTLFFQPFFDNKASAQTNPRYFNERFVVRALLTITAAEATYSATVGSGNYGSLADLLQANFIDPVLASGDKYGYSFALFVTPATTMTPARFYVTATPRRYPRSGRRSFYIDESGEMRGADKSGAVANVSDAIIDSCSASGISNESCTIRDLRTIHSAQMTYMSTAGSGNFGTFSQLINAGLLRPTAGFSPFRGYFRQISVTAVSTGNPALFYVTTRPEVYGQTGVRSFYIDETGVLRGADRNGQYATVNDPPIEN